MGIRAATAQPSCRYQTVPPIIGSNATAVVNCNDIPALQSYQLCTLKTILAWGNSNTRITGLQQYYNCSIAPGKNFLVQGQVCGTTKIDPPLGNCTYQTFPYTQIVADIYVGLITMLRFYEDGGFLCSLGVTGDAVEAALADGGYSYAALSTYFDAASELVAFQLYECPITW